MCEASYQDAAPPAAAGGGSPTITRKAIKVGNYVLLRTIGTGSSSEVKLAENTATGDLVAVKVRSLNVHA
jgi:serine/threonine protein kinase